MDCYEIAKRIMDRISKSIGYRTQNHQTYKGIQYYNSSNYISEYFHLNDDYVKVLVTHGRIYEVIIDQPKGIILFNLRLWLLEADRLTK